MVKLFKKLLDTAIKYKKKLFLLLFELIIIVIGIFLGLQADRYNENRKESERELLILRDIKSDLLASKFQIKETIRRNKIHLNELKKIQHAISNYDAMPQNIYSSFSSILNWETPYLTSIAYQTLKSNELGLMKNSKLKDLIISLHEKDFLYIIKDYDATETDFNKAVTWPIMIDNMTSYKYPNDEFSPKNFAKLKSDTRFSMMLNFLVKLRFKGIKSMTNINLKIDNILNQIDNETNTK